MRLELINSADRTIHALKWKAFFALNPQQNPKKKETYGFNSISPAPPVQELEDFRNDFLELIKNVEFNKRSNPLQKKLKEDCKKIKQEKRVLVAADKTTNFYKMDAKDYNKLVEKSVTSEYKKTTKDKVDKITDEDRQLVTKLEIGTEYLRQLKEKLLPPSRTTRKISKTTQK